MAEPATAEETSRMVRIRKVVMDMLRDRGYVVTDPELQMTNNHTFRMKYGANWNSARERLTIKKVMRSDSSEQIHVFFCENLGKADIQAYTKFMAVDNVNRAIFVVQHKITSISQRFINESTDYHFEVFLESELVINITEHVLVPKHSVLTAEEKNTLLERYTVKEEQIPRIHLTNPVAKYFGLKHGQVVRIIRPSETAERYCLYRYVV